MSRPRKADKHLPPGLYVKHWRNTDTYFTIIQGKYHGLGNVRKDAEQKLRDLREGRPVADTIADMIERFIKELELKLLSGSRDCLSRRTIDDYTAALRTKFIPIFGHMKPMAFKSRHAAQYLSHPDNANRKVRANRELAALGSAFAYGMTIGVVDANPCHGVRRNKEFAREREVSIAELNRFIEVADGMGEGYFMVALIGATVGLTGRRRAEILTLRKSDITDQGLMVKEAKAKPGQTPRTFEVALTPVLLEILDRSASRKLRDKLNTLYVFPTRDGTPYSDQGFKGMWNRIMHAYAEKGGEWFTAHDLRALYVSKKLERGEDPNTHKNPETMRRVYDRRKRVKVAPLA